MIGWFPKPYEDELCYSVFARYFARSGYICYTSASEELFVNSKVRPNIEFCNLLSNEVQTQIGSIKSFIHNHTMLNYYIFSLCHDKQTKALELAYSMNLKELLNVLPMPKSKTTRYLKHCPLCIKEDREKFGETYWHRAHQIFGISACYKHGCKLINSNVSIASTASPSLINAELSFDNTCNFVSQALPLEVDIAKYSFEILRINASSQTSVASYLNDKLSETSYLSVRGAKRYIGKLSLDFTKYYKDIDLLGFGMPWQIEKVLNGSRLNSFEISLIGLFLDISARELSTRSKSFKTRSTKDFDNKIKQLKSSGLNYREIADELHLSYDYTKLLGNGGRKNLKGRVSSHKGGHRIEWEKLDEKTFSKIVCLVTELNTIGTSRPKKISVSLIERMAGLKECQLKRMPRCLEFVKINTISQEEHWARTIAWAIYKLNSESRVVNISNILKITNMRKKYIEAALPFLNLYLDSKIENDLFKNILS